MGAPTNMIRDHTTTTGEMPIEETIRSVDLAELGIDASALRD